MRKFVSIGMLLALSLAPVQGCSPIAGYTLLKNKDHNGDNIGGPITGIYNVAAACSAERTCKGWNSNGYMKTKTTTTAASGVCFYIKIDCWETPGYIAYHNADHPGDDFSLSPITNYVAAACSEKTNCLSYTSTGYIKTSASVTHYQSFGTCFYVKKVCNAIPGYIAYHNADHPGDDISTIPITGNVAAACSERNNCFSFTSTGYIKTSSSVTTYRSYGTCFYVKKGCKVVPGYTVYHNADHNGNDILKVTSGDVAAKCSEDNNCLSWNSNGYIKTQTSITTYVSYGTCFYVKQRCQEFKGYVAYHNADHSGDDSFYTHGDLSYFAATCSQTSSCYGWNSSGYMKSKDTVTTYQAYGTCFYRKIRCPWFYGFDEYHNMDHLNSQNNDDILKSYTDFNSGGNGCKSDINCRGFNSINSGTGPVQSKWRSSRSQVPGVCFYVKAECPQFDGYVTYKNKQPAAGTVYTYSTGGSLSVVNEFCSVDSSCLGWDSDGNLFNSTAVTDTADLGVCLFIKMYVPSP